MAKALDNSKSHTEKVVPISIPYNPSMGNAQFNARMPFNPSSAFLNSCFPILKKPIVNDVTNTCVFPQSAEQNINTVEEYMKLLF